MGHGNHYTMKHWVWDLGGPGWPAKKISVQMIQYKMHQYIPNHIFFEKNPVSYFENFIK